MRTSVNGNHRAACRAQLSAATWFKVFGPDGLRGPHLVGTGGGQVTLRVDRTPQVWLPYQIDNIFTYYGSGGLVL